MSSDNNDTTYTSLCSEKTLQSNEAGFFMTFAENVSGIAGDEWVKSVFGKISSDKDRLKCLYENDVTKKVINEVLSNVQEIYRKKDAEISQAKRLEAEKALKAGNYLKSVALYSQSVIKAPQTGQNPNVDDGVSLSLALWGRAQALIAMKKYKQALNDILLASKENLPANLKSKLYWKMAICYTAIGESNRAKVSFGLAEELIDHKEEIEELRKEMEETYTDESLKNRVLPTVTGEIHPEYKNASSRIAIKETKELGRFAVANGDISTGDTLVVEVPYAACLLPEAFGTHCQHCFEKLLSPVGCSDCCSVAFCSPECRDNATYHQYECKILDLLIGSGMSVLSHTALRMITQQRVEKCLEICADKSKEKVYSLCTNSERREPKDFLQRAIMAAFLLRCLQKSGYFASLKKTGDNIIPSEDEYKIGELLLYNLQMLQFNAHEIFERRVKLQDRFSGVKMANIGVAVYPTVSLFNHECYPAVTRYFIGKNIVVNAIRPLKTGDVIAENYGPIFTRKTTAERKKSLAARYWFECKCTACQQNWPSFSSGLKESNKRIRCPTDNCLANFTLNTVGDTIKCPNCEKDVNLVDSKSKLKWCEEQYKLAAEAIKSQKPQEAISTLCPALNTFHRISVAPHYETHLAEGTLRECFADSGNVAENLIPY